MMSAHASLGRLSVFATQCDRGDPIGARKHLPGSRRQGEALRPPVGLVAGAFDPALAFELIERAVNGGSGPNIRAFHQLANAECRAVRIFLADDAQEFPRPKIKLSGASLSLRRSKRAQHMKNEP